MATTDILYPQLMVESAQMMIFSAKMTLSFGGKAIYF